MMEAEYRVVQNGDQVALVAGRRSDAWQEIMHYASMYAQDGPCAIEYKEKGRWKEVAHYQGAV